MKLGWNKFIFLQIPPTYRYYLISPYLQAVFFCFFIYFMHKLLDFQNEFEVFKSFLIFVLVLV